MIVIKFTLELDIGLSLLLQAALSQLVTDRETKTHRRGRSKRSYGQCRRRTEIPEAEPPIGTPDALSRQSVPSGRGCAARPVRSCVLVMGRQTTHDYARFGWEQASAPSRARLPRWTMPESTPHPASTTATAEESSCALRGSPRSSRSSAAAVRPTSAPATARSGLTGVASCLRDAGCASGGARCS